MDDEPIAIPLAPAQWQQRLKLIAEEKNRRAQDGRDSRRRENDMSAEEAKLIPAAGVWVCVGAVRDGDFTEEDAAAGFPDDAIWDRCPPEPVIAWRVSRNGPVDGFGPFPNLILPTEEIATNVIDCAFGSTPAEAVMRARRLLTVSHDLKVEAKARCEAAGHRIAALGQPASSATCTCKARRVVFVEGGEV